MHVPQVRQMRRQRVGNRLVVLVDGAGVKGDQLVVDVGAAERRLDRGGVRWGGAVSTRGTQWAKLLSRGSTRVPEPEQIGLSRLRGHADQTTRTPNPNPAHAGIRYTSL